jgi:hypothetical protein
MQQTRQWSRALDETFTIRLPYDPAVLLVQKFIQMGPPGTDLEGGSLAFQLENSSGAVINPSTEDKQDDEITVLLEANDRIGPIHASPTANTVQARLKSLEDKTGEVQASPTANTTLARLKSLEDKLGEVHASPTENTVLERLKVLETAIDKLPLKAGTPTIYNVTLTSANTEYSQVLPANTKRFSVHLRDYATFRVAYVTGKVAAPTAPYLTIAANGELYNEGLDVSSKTLYLASPSAGKTAEIEVWV